MGGPRGRVPGGVRGIVRTGRFFDATVPDEDAVNEVVGEFSRWMRSTLRTTALLAVLSFASTAIVGTLLVVAQRSIEGGAGTIAIPGLTMPIEADWLGSGLPVLVVALAVWMAMSSLTDLAHATVVRRYLRLWGASNSTMPSNAIPDDELEPSTSGRGGLMVERVLLESYFSVVTFATRALALSLAILTLQPRQTALGLAACWLLLVALGARRFREGICSSLEFATMNRAVRLGQRTQMDLIVVIYARDRRVTRLPLGQALVATATPLLLVLLPLWVFTSPLPVAGLVLFVIWLPSFVATLTQAGPLGWRAATSFTPPPQNLGSDRADSDPPAGEEESSAAPSRPRVIVTTPPIIRWGGRTPLWVPTPGVDRTVVLVVDATGHVGSWPATIAVRDVARLDWAVLAIPRAVASGRQLLPGEEPGQRLANYLGKSTTIVLAGGQAYAAATALARQLDVARAVIFDACPDSETDESVCFLPPNALQRLLMDGKLASMLESWAS